MDSWTFGTSHVLGAKVCNRSLNGRKTYGPQPIVEAQKPDGSELSQYWLSEVVGSDSSLQ